MPDSDDDDDDVIDPPRVVEPLVEPVRSISAEHPHRDAYHRGMVEQGTPPVPPH